jgi:Ser/Thr protein kinase RdoA (MazF antagonist)
MVHDLPRLRQALRHFLGDAAEHAAIAPLGDGLINDTYLVEQERGRSVLQRVNPLFHISVHKDIEAITRHLLRHGLETPLLLPTRAGELAVDLGPEGVFRLLTWVPGHTVSIMRRDLAQEAGRLVGRFHLALSDLAHSFHFTRPGAHDLTAHLGALEGALSRAGAAPDGFAELAAEVLARARRHPPHVPGPLRICHGDLKISNLRFDDQGRGLCLLDLDTLAHLPLLIELGDALRSWCNPGGEDQAQVAFDLDLFRRAVSGYADTARDLLLPEEREGLVEGVLRIALELAARFLADVVNDRYFRYDPARFPSRAAHNLVRGRGQLLLARSIEAQRGAAEAIVRGIFG